MHVVKEAARSPLLKLVLCKHLMNSVTNSHDNPASGSSVLIIDLNPKDSGSLWETYCGGWVRKGRDILDFLVKDMQSEERHIAYCNMTWCFLNSYQQNCFNTNRRKQNWAQSAHPAGTSGDRPCIPWVRGYWGAEGTSVWLLSQEKFKQNLLRSPWWSS